MSAFSPPSRRTLRALYFTLTNGVYDMNVTSFGSNATGKALSLIPEFFA